MPQTPARTALTICLEAVISPWYFDLAVAMPSRMRSCASVRGFVAWNVSTPPTADPGTGVVRFNTICRNARTPHQQVNTTPASEHNGLHGAGGQHSSNSLIQQAKHSRTGLPIVDVSKFR